MISKLRYEQRPDEISVGPVPRRESGPSPAKRFPAGRRACCILLLSLLLGACAAQRPVLYPNEHYKQVGTRTAERDISDCMRLAKAAGAYSGGKGAAAGRRAAESAAVGGAAGAGYGAVRGDVGRSAAAGAAAAGAGSLMHSAIHSSDHEDPVFRNYVDRCLRDRGYDPIGWR